MSTRPPFPTEPTAAASQMARLIREHDWAATELGPPEAWPASLRTALRIVLGSRYRMFVWWGPRFINLYNDAYAGVLGNKHPQALGRSAADIWAEIWDVVGPQAERVLREGESTLDEELLLVLERHGYVEETYFTFSYSPAPDDDGSVGGLFCACTEDTQRVLGERRLKTLRRLAAFTADAQTVAEACTLAAQVLAESPRDVTFALVYLVEEGVARLAAKTGLPDDALAPAEVHLAGPAPNDPWRLADALATRRILRGAACPPGLPGGDWPEATETAMVLPIAPREERAPVGLLVAGVSPRRELDDAYEGFFDLVAGSLFSAISNARDYEDETRRAEALAELDRAKTVFFTNVSHELRTPLTLLLGPCAEALEEIDDAQARARLLTIQRNALRLRKLVDTLLDFSQLEAGRVQASYAPTDLAAATTDLATAFRSAIERAGLDFRVRCDPLSRPVYVDAELYEKIVLNLLSNALKYTLEGEVCVRLREDGDAVELSVRDTGVGIAKDELPRVFERFHRVAGSEARTQEGTGIGLALVSELVKLHGGSVDVRSTVGEGSTFTVRLPFGSAHLPPHQVVTEEPGPASPVHASHFVEEALRWQPHPEDAGALHTGPVDLPPPGRRSAALRPRIVWADDNADMRAYVARLLSSQFDVEAVADGEAALAAVRRETPALVLVDVMMPRLDGFGLLKALRADADLRNLPVILLSARAGEEDRMEGLAQGADDYLVKPFVTRELLARVESALRLSELRRQSEEELQASEERFRNMADHAPVMVWVTEADGSCTFISRSWYEFTGRAPDTALGLGWLDAVHQEDRERVRRQLLDATARREAFRLEYRLRGADGADHWVLDGAQPRFGLDGTFQGFIGSVLDITERREIEQALRESDRRKDEFLATLAHELRNPIAPIRAAIDVLRARGGADPEEVDLLAMLDRQTTHLIRLVDDLLDVARITRGVIQLQTDMLDLREVLRTAVESCQPLLDERSHELVLSLPDEALPVEGDRVRLTQVFANLITNANRYTDDGGRIDVTAKREGAELSVTVRDTGHGIEPELREHVFDLFCQGEPPNADQRGLGVGLTLVRSLTSLHEGRVSVASEGAGRGSEFTVVLPACAGAASRATEDAQVDDDARAGGQRVLVVDDNRDAADSLAMLLRTVGSEVEVAYSGPDALEVVERFDPSIALLDLGMPGMDGFKLASELRAAHGARMKLVALTGWSQEDDRRRTAASGFDAHLVKPADLDAIRALLAD